LFSQETVLSAAILPKTVLEVRGFHLGKALRVFRICVAEIRKCVGDIRISSVFANFRPNYEQQIRGLIHRSSQLWAPLTTQQLGRACYCCRGRRIAHLISKNDLRRPACSEQMNENLTIARSVRISAAFEMALRLPSLLIVSRMWDVRREILLHKYSREWDQRHFGYPS
jgi:hypothetical protein